jgi:hypothetical protein
MAEPATESLEPLLQRGTLEPGEIVVGHACGNDGVNARCGIALENELPLGPGAARDRDGLR